MATEKRAPKTKLEDEHKFFIVQRLACYASPKDVISDFKTQYGFELSPQAVEAYDPNKYAGRRLSKRWRELFAVTRKAFLEHVENSVPNAHKSVRVAKLSRAADHFESRGNYMAMKEMLEAVAKELGNVHTNRREVTGKDGGPLQFQDMTDEQMDGRLAALLGALMGDGGHARGSAAKSKPATKA